MSFTKEDLIAAAVEALRNIELGLDPETAAYLAMDFA